MAIDEARLETLLLQVQSQGDAVGDVTDAGYREAFIAAKEALEMLIDERENWRQMVARATEEFQGDEGI
ncbi:hypothetical protein [Pseudomonas matsuisoli]|jgi:hypothetical protein|uniref:Uncharacterized protein n=1 Tax=Pseudomonas matsuisoli TaxID=1515666 RepID=A0A917PKI7_9PSED|nr:hypothetical protein [Pseudomonas matsuisoli]GGJ82941.1 hypothetical protein GCM10009304_06230 [Pseudomonas matsuisoli]